MCASSHQTAPTFDARQAIITMRNVMWGAGIVMVFAGGLGLIISIISADNLPAGRAAFSAGLTAMVFAGIMVIAVGGLRSHLTLLRHQLVIDARLAHIEDVLEDQAEIVANVLTDDLRHRRSCGHGYSG